MGGARNKVKWPFSKGGDFLKRNGRKYDLFLAELLAFWGIVA
jgi:hypothetical protein